MIAATTGIGGPPWMPVSWTTAWPLPRAISQRLSGTVTMPATDSANARLPQNRMLSSPSSMAPGISTMIALSTISMVAMLSVSEASAIGITTERARPARSSGRLVSR